MVLDLKTFPKKKNELELYHCKTPDKEWAWVETNHFPPQDTPGTDQTNGTKYFGRIGKNGKKVISRKILIFCRKFSTEITRSIWILPGITGFSIQMVSASWQGKTTTLHVHHAFLYISLPSLHDYQVKMFDFTFCEGRKHADNHKILSLYELGYGR